MPVSWSRSAFESSKLLKTDSRPCPPDLPDETPFLRHFPSLADFVTFRRFPPSSFSTNKNRNLSTRARSDRAVNAKPVKKRRQAKVTSSVEPCFSITTLPTFDIRATSDGYATTLTGGLPCRVLTRLQSVEEMSRCRHYRRLREAVK